MSISPTQKKLLDTPLDPRRVFGRQGSGGKTLSYLQTHDVKRTANKIFGYDGWSYQVDELVCLGEEPFKNRQGKEGIRVGYRATVGVTIGEGHGGPYRTDVGYGDAMEYNGSKITPHELAAKEAVSDALKRALASFGDQFGLVLYGPDPAPVQEPSTPDAPASSPQPGADPARLEPTGKAPAGESDSDEPIAAATHAQLVTVFAEIRKVNPENTLLAQWDERAERAKKWPATTGAVWVQKAMDERDLLLKATPA